MAKAGKRKPLPDGIQPPPPSLSSQPSRKRKAPKEPAAPKRRSSRLRAKMFPVTTWKVEVNHPPPKEETPEEIIQRLEKIIENLRKNIGKMRVANSYIHGNFVCWRAGAIDEWPHLMGMIFHCATQWAFRHGHVEIQALDRLTKEQKSQLIASLDGYCLQEDYDTLLSHISPSIRDHVPHLFLAAYLIKFIVKHFFKRPFWSMTTRPDPADRGKSALHKDTILVDELERFYEIFAKVGLDYARAWQTMTFRLCNAVTRDQGLDVTFGKQMREHRNAASRRFVSTLLADPIVQLLLREPEFPLDEIQRVDSLGAQFENAAQTATLISSDATFMEVYDLSNLAPQFHHASESVKAWPLHDIDYKKGETTLDGHRVVLLTEPAVVGFSKWSASTETYVALKGFVLIEDLRDLL